MRPATPPLLGAFLIFATAMAALAAITLLAPGTPLDAAWRIKPAEYRQLLAMGPAVGLGFVALSGAAAIIAAGVFGRRRWPWRAAVVGIALNGAGDAIRALTGAWVEGLVGVAVTAANVWWLTRPHVRAAFDR
jgi:hypothetical protein